MKITINMLENANIEYSWSTIYVALLNNFIEKEEVVIFAIKQMEKNDYVYDEYINDLAFENLETHEIIEKILEGKMIDKKNLFEKKELLKIQYTILLDIKQSTTKSKEKMIKKIAEVYADFNYPKEMSNFIYYMPSNELIYDKEYGENKILEKFNNYLKKILKIINE